MRYTALIVLLALTGCQSHEEHRAKWIGICAKHEFSLVQCRMLFTLFHNSTSSPIARLPMPKEENQ